MRAKPHHRRTRNVFSVTVLSLIAAVNLAGCSAEDANTADTPETITPPAMDEVLLLQPPPAWLRLSEQVGEAFRLAEFIPAGQDKDAWLDRIFVESNALTPLPDPLLFLEAMGKELTTACEGSSDTNIHSGMENGYETSVRLLICNKNKESARGEVRLIKAIRGNDNFYVVSRARRSEPLHTDSAPLSDREMGEWSLYMRSIKLCDPRNDDHPCPATVGQESPDPS